MNNDFATALGNAGATTIAVGSVLGYLPAVAALVSIIWFSIQIWESKTTQGLVSRWSARRVKADVATAKQERADDAKARIEADK